jgi:Uma2 family endonuclease
MQRRIAPQDRGYSVDRYFTLDEAGALEADDRVELLEGLIVSAPPQSPLHAGSVMRVEAALRRAIGSRATFLTHLPLVLGSWSAPEPDVAVVAGTERDYDYAHPDSALLVVEVSDTSLAQDRLTKTRLYAAAGIREYWIVNLRARRLEVHREPHRDRRLYGETTMYERGDHVELLALPGARVAVAELMPGYSPILR